MPRLEPLRDDEVLVSREYSITRNGSAERVRLRVGTPRRRSDGRYECGAEITQNGSLRVWPMNGIDALQALILALKMAELELEQLSGGDSTAIQWMDGTERGAGLWADT